MGSKEIKNTKTDQNTAVSDSAREEKIRIPVYLQEDTVEMINKLYRQEDCRSKTEFIEKAIQFYCGYLLTRESAATDFLAPQIGTLTEGIVKGSEQKICRAMFKIAVELGAVTHMLAAMNQIDEKTLFKLRSMCTDEVRQINGVINFERAVRYQHEE